MKYAVWSIKYGAIFVFVFLLYTLYPLLYTAHAQSLETKHIDVNLTNQTLYAFNGNQLIYQFPISSGKWGPTPTGTFYPWYKTPAIRMVGGSKALGTFYDLPNVPYDIFFYQGYAIHGAYWHNNFGHPMSHGCINMSVPASQLIYNWSPSNVLIRIYGVTPTG